MAIQELIVVEGKNDAQAIRRAFGPVDVIWTEGFGLTEEKLNLIAEMAVRRGVIVCTDPDFAGQKIRERILRRVPNARQVFLSRACAYNEKGDDLGLENVSPEEIRKAFAKVLGEKSLSPGTASKAQSDGEISMQDLLEHGLVGQAGSAGKRRALGKILGIGDTNAKQFLYRVNRFGLRKREFLEALASLPPENEEENKPI
ncbi:MAG TPA: ribonuclease M5 [Peptococcaceae bacterium]|nr:ribonuclease M5 [Peptococcaceae bacterium]